MTDFQITPFDVATATDPAWDDLIALEAAYNREADPDDPPVSPDLQRVRIETGARNPKYDTRTFLAYGPGTASALGRMVVGLARKGSPDYARQKHMAFVMIFVQPHARGQGLGTHLLRHAIQVADENNITLLQTIASTDPGRAFAARAGFEIMSDSKGSRLYMREVDWDLIRAWCEEGAQRSPGVDVIGFEGAYEDDLAGYSQLYTEIFNQQPLEGFEGLETTFTPEHMRQRADRAQLTGDIWYTLVTREADGAISGMTEILRNPQIPHAILQLLTGVSADYRGRGLGKWLKAAMLQHIRATYPDAVYVQTENMATHDAMLSINARMGFRPHRSATLYKGDFAVIRARVDGV